MGLREDGIRLLGGLEQDHVAVGLGAVAELGGLSQRASSILGGVPTDLRRSDAALFLDLSPQAFGLDGLGVTGGDQLRRTVREGGFCLVVVGGGSGHRGLVVSPRRRADLLGLGVRAGQVPGRLGPGGGHCLLAGPGRSVGHERRLVGGVREDGLGLVRGFLQPMLRQRVHLFGVLEPLGDEVELRLHLVADVRRFGPRPRDLPVRGGPCGRGLPVGLAPHMVGIRLGTLEDAVAGGRGPWRRLGTAC